MRRKLVESGLLECVLGLGPGLFYNSPMEAVVVILRSTPQPGREGKVLFINAVNEYYRQSAQSFLSEANQDRILNAYRAFEEEPGFSAVVDVQAILDKDASLAIPLYVAGAKSPEDAEGVLTVEDAVATWRHAADEADAAVDDVLAMLTKEAE